MVISLLIAHPTKFSSGTVNQITYYLLMHSIVPINNRLSTIFSVLYTYTMTISAPSLFTLYKIQISVFHLLNTYFRVVLLIYSLKQKHSACTILQIYFISVSISSNIYFSSSNSDIPSGIFMYISYYNTAYKSDASMHIVW